jgi:hypothetical protein
MREMCNFRWPLCAFAAVLAAPAGLGAQTIEQCDLTPEHVWIELLHGPDGIATNGDEVNLRVHVPQPTRKLASVQVLLDGDPKLTIGAQQLANIGNTNPLDVPIQLEVQGDDPFKLQLEPDSRIGVTVFAYDEERNGASNCGHQTFDLRTGKIATYAVVIGFNYVGQPWGLHWAQNDAESIVKHLIEKGRVLPQNIWLLTDDTSASERWPAVHVTAPVVTVEDIDRALDKIYDEADYSATLFFYFSGHQLVPDKNDITFTSPKYMVLGKSDITVEGTMLPQSRLYQMLSRERAKTISILDACFSGSTDAAYPGPAPRAALGAKVAGRFYPYGDPEELPQLRRASRIASSGARNASWEFDQLKHGLFTYYMLEAGDHLAQNISVQEAFKYAKDKIRNYRPDPPIGGFAQQPDAQFHSDSMDEIWGYHGTSR